MELLKDEIAQVEFLRGNGEHESSMTGSRPLHHERRLTMNVQAYSALRIPLLLMFLVLGGLSGCAETTKVSFVRSMPSEVDLKPKGVESIAVLNLDGPGDSGSSLSELLTTKLVQGNYYKVVERERLNKVMNEHKLAMTGFIDEQTAQEVGKLVAVNAILMGKVNTYSVKDEPYTKTVMVTKGTGRYRRDCNSQGKCQQVEIFEQVPTQENHHRRVGTVSATQKVVDVKSGGVLAAKDAAESYLYDTGDRGVMDVFNKPAPELGEAEALTYLTGKVAEALTGQIQPHTIQEEGEFELGGMSRFLGELGADKEIKHAIDMTKAGRVDEAIQKYKSMVSSNPQNCTAHYNLGIIYMQSKDHQKAQSALRAAENCNPKPRYTAAVGECAKREQSKR